MKAFFPATLALATLLPAHAQTTPAATMPTPAQAKVIRTKTAARRAKQYQGPKVVSNSEELGRKMMQKSKPTARHMGLPRK